jgi:hypothetical protein
MTPNKQPTNRADARRRATGNPRIEITPSITEYRQLCRNLKALRDAGAESNTEAILKAVEQAVAAGRITRKTANRMRA